MYGTIQVMLFCCTGLTVVLLILLSMPKSQLRAFLLPVVGWIMVVFCGVYCISPIDLFPEAFFGPFGFVDDVGAVAAGIGGMRAMSAGKK